MVYCGLALFFGLCENAKLLRSPLPLRGWPYAKRWPIKALQKMGFKREAILRDYFVTSSGEKLDMVILSLQLQNGSGKF